MEMKLGMHACYIIPMTTSHNCVMGLGVSVCSNMFTNHASCIPSLSCLSFHPYMPLFLIRRIVFTWEPFSYKLASCWPVGSTLCVFYATEVLPCKYIHLNKYSHLCIRGWEALQLQISEWVCKHFTGIAFGTLPFYTFGLLFGTLLINTDTCTHISTVG